MELRHTADFSGSHQKSVRTFLRSFFRAVLATAAVRCAGTFAQAQTVTTIYNFGDNGTSGATPWYVTLAPTNESGAGAPPAPSSSSFRQFESASLRIPSIGINALGGISPTNLRAATT